MKDFINYTTYNLSYRVAGHLVEVNVERWWRFEQIGDCHTANITIKREGAATQHWQHKCDIEEALDGDVAMTLANYGGEQEEVLV